MTEVVIAFDYGMRRIGVATGNRLTGTASPLTTIPVRDGLPNWSEIDACIRAWAPQILIVGEPPLPPEHPVTVAIREFVQQLQNRYKLETHCVSEHLTSREAESELIAARRSGARTRRITKGDIDRQAACLIAEQWMASTSRDG